MMKYNHLADGQFVTSLSTQKKDGGTNDGAYIWVG